ncbi:hypothetical protein ACFSKI_19225 [Pseudogracilibacillus auburnensis]|uniref:Uncharacterized protein n=1 Tax=Pseudogracilibacillus auburnensis TaxID=1494959 RepID=A0A2V3W4B9_9BACI|nr:hypothetical protein [Pseudogracilibacillus auburnensis]PXW88830.1 hypothetical protein DFR56_103336 [Pseudogracilibacillus auburnensis]
MIETYSRNAPGRIKVFFVLDENDNVTSIKTGNRVVSTDQGFQFFVDNYVADQIDKCELYLDGFTPKLRVKEGETIFVPELSEREREIERLKYELEVLQNEEEVINAE